MLKQYGKSTVNDFRGKRTSAEDLGYEFGHDPISALDSVEMEKIAEKSRNRKIKDRINKFKDREIKENELIEVTEEETGLVIKEAADPINLIMYLRLEDSILSMRTTWLEPRKHSLRH